MIPVKTFKLKELSEIFPNTESAKGKILEADPNFERYMTIYQDIKKKLTVYYRLHLEKNGNTVQKISDKFLTKKYSALSIPLSQVLPFPFLPW